MEQSQKELNDLQDIVFSLEKSFQDKEAEALSEFQSLRDEIKTKVGCSSYIQEQQLSQGRATWSSREVHVCVNNMGLK